MVGLLFQCKNFFPSCFTSVIATAELRIIKSSIIKIFLLLTGSIHFEIALNFKVNMHWIFSPEAHASGTDSYPA